MLLQTVTLGALVGVAVVFVKHALSGGAVDPELMKKHVNVPVYATIAHSKRQDRIYKKLKSKDATCNILATDNPDDIAIERKKPHDSIALRHTGR